MTVREFAGKYYFHDSFFEDVSFESKTHTVTLLVNFAFWMQKDYVEGRPETGLLEVKFYGVSEFVYPDNVDLNSSGILQTYLDENTVTFAMSNDMTDEYWEMKVTADSVDAVER